MEEQVQTGNMTVFPLATIDHLPNLWLSPVLVIPKERQLPRLVFVFTWIVLNKKTTRKSPLEETRFGGTLHRILIPVLSAYPQIGLVCIIKLDLAKYYMRLWVYLEDISPVALLIPKIHTKGTQLVGFHFIFPWGLLTPHHTFVWLPIPSPTFQNFP